MLQNSTQRLKRNLNPPPPIVTATGRDTYRVHSRRSGNDYIAHVTATGQIVCGCPARKTCYHLRHVARVHESRLLFRNDPLQFLRQKLEQITRLAQSETPDFALLDSIGRAAHKGLDAVDELEAIEKREAA